jgi:uncharacterized delta-60 repeat protein
MRGSILVTFDELVDDRGIDSFAVFINGILRDSHWTDINNYYSTYVNVGQVVEIQILYQGSSPNLISLVRKDFTTDDEGGDNGIKETSITPTITNPTPTIYNIRFTATTRNDAYNFHYVATLSTTTPPTPTPTVTPTPTPTPTPVCWNYNNSLDSWCTSITEQPDNKLILLGLFTTYKSQTYYRIIRIDQYSNIDTSFIVGTGFISNVPKVLNLQSDGKMIIGGDFTTYSGVTSNKIIRLNSNGSVDNTFNVGTGFSGTTVNSLQIQSNGKVIAAGNFTSYQGNTTQRIVRINTDGSWDNSFSGATDSTINSTQLQSDGKILAGGNFTLPYNRICRFNTDGSVDTSFDPVGGFNLAVGPIKLQSDGKVICGGSFTSFDSPSYSPKRIARLLSNGSYDTSFNTGTGFNTTVNTIQLQSDGKIIIGGNFTSYNGTTSNRIIRLNTDGTVDNTFSIGTGFNNNVYSITVLSSDDILVSGDFTTYNGNSAIKLIKLNSNGTVFTC